MRLTTIALALLALAACHKSSTPVNSPSDPGLTPAEATGAENTAGSYPDAPAAVPGSSGSGATGVSEPIDQPPAANTPTR
jgi:hypothetical protein